MVLTEKKSGDSRVSIESHGSYTKSLTLSGVDILMESPDGIQTHGGMALLIPYANRIRNATYSWKGKKYILPNNDGNNSIHGFAREMDWNRSLDGDTITFDTIIQREDYPSILKCEAAFTIDRNSLDISLRFTNIGRESTPLSVGMHPYFIHGGKWSLSSDNEIEILNYIDSYFPDGTSRRLNTKSISSSDSREYDNCFVVGSKLRLSTRDYDLIIQNENMGYAVVYNGKYTIGRSIAVEPMTSAPDSFNNGIGLVNLTSKSTFSCGSRLTLIEK